MKPEPPDLTQGEAIDAAIYLTGYDTAEVARAAGIASNTLRNFINGRYPLSDDSIRKISKYLGILGERVLALPLEIEDQLDVEEEADV